MHLYLQFFFTHVWFSLKKKTTHNYYWMMAFLICRCKEVPFLCKYIVCIWLNTGIPKETRFFFRNKWAHLSWTINCSNSIKMWCFAVYWLVEKVSLFSTHPVQYLWLQHYTNATCCHSIFAPLLLPTFLQLKKNVAFLLQGDHSPDTLKFPDISLTTCGTHVHVKWYS